VAQQAAREPVVRWVLLALLRIGQQSAVSAAGVWRGVGIEQREELAAIPLLQVEQMQQCEGRVGLQG
jgi:hypothetical protein